MAQNCPLGGLQFKDSLGKVFIRPHSQPIKSCVWGHVPAIPAMGWWGGVPGVGGVANRRIMVQASTGMK
jgi:hypothetical protein